MIKKTITYVDYDGNERTEDCYFNFSKAELVEMNLSTEGGLEAKLRKIIEEKDTPKIVELWKKILLDAYGIKSEDGRRFIKSEEISKEFSQTEAYSNLFMELSFDEEKAIEFVNGVIPKNLEK